MLIHVSHKFEALCIKAIPKVLKMENFNFLPKLLKKSGQNSNSKFESEIAPEYLDLYLQH